MRIFLSRIVQSLAANTSLCFPATLLNGWRLLLLRVAWVGVALLSAIHLIAGLLVSQNGCSGSGCLLSPGTLQILRESGISANTVVLYFLVLTAIISGAFLLIGGLIFWRAAQEPMAFYTAFTLVTFGSTALSRTDSLVLLVPVWAWVVTGLTFLGQTSSILFFYLFPDMRFVPNKTFWLAVVSMIVAGCIYFFPAMPLSRWFLATLLIWTTLFFVSGIISQLYRYRTKADTIQRQQTRWVLFGFTFAIISYMLYEGIRSLLLYFHVYSAFFLLIGETFVAFTLIIIPLCIGVAILRYRLWQIDWLINRALMYGLLTAGVAALYVLVVAGFAAILQTSNNLFIALVATGLVAMLVQPLRAVAQRSVNRFMYGERDDPSMVLTRLGQRLDAALAPDVMLQTIVETIARALKLPYAAILLQQADTSKIVAEYGASKEGNDATLLHLPLAVHAEQVGEMILAPRSAQAAFNEADLKLLRELARRAELVVHSARLTTDLQRLSVDLQHSRERLVLAREEERRRIRRDLHDGLAPTLAALAMNASIVSELIPDNPAVAIRLSGELEQEIRTAIGDIRRLVYDLRPPTLDQLGLIAAIQEYALQQVPPGGRDSSGEQAPRSQLQVTIEAPESLPPLPAAVEVAAYRIVQEGLMNVVKHARAQNCLIRLSFSSDVLQIEVIDDGIGFSAERRSGVGLLSMEERAAELGGTCTIGNNAKTGTGVHVQARLPVLKEP